MNAPLRDRRVLITGGAGFIGSHLVDEAMRQQATQVSVLDSLVRGSSYPRSW